MGVLGALGGALRVETATTMARRRRDAAREVSRRTRGGRLPRIDVDGAECGARAAAAGRCGRRWPPGTPRRRAVARGTAVWPHCCAGAVARASGARAGAGAQRRAEPCRRRRTRGAAAVCAERRLGRDGRGGARTRAASSGATGERRREGARRVRRAECRLGVRGMVVEAAAAGGVQRIRGVGAARVRRQLARLGR
jgi:hypothetical protein